jgi:alkylhydroperoxidase family enzyme
VSWLGVDAGAGTPLERVLGVHPDALDAVKEFYSLFWTEGLLDPQLLELMRLRIAHLYGCAAELNIRYDAAAGIEDKIAELPQWPTSPVFTDVERACLRVAEQFVIDAHEITDDDVAPITTGLGSPGLVAVMNAIALFDYLDRIRTLFDIPSESDDVVVVPSPAPDRPLH